MRCASQCFNVLRRSGRVLERHNLSRLYEVARQEICMSVLLQRALAVLFLIAVFANVPARAQTTIDAYVQFDRAIADAKATMLVDPKTTVAHAQAAEILAQKLPMERRNIAIATAKWLQGEASLRVNKLREAGLLIEEADTLARRNGKLVKLNGDILMSKGGYDTAVAKVADALAAYQRAHNIFRDISETRSQSTALISIAMLYQEAGDRVNALRYYGQALEVYRGDSQLLFSIYGNRGVLYSDLNQLVEAQAQFIQALALARVLGSPMLEARTLRNLARGQLKAGQLAAADRNIKQGFRIARGDNSGVTVQHFRVLSARSAQLHGRLAQADKEITSAFAGVDLATTTIDLREGHQAAYEIYKSLGKEKLALAHLEALKRLEDETSKLAASTNTALAAARFDFAGQELKLEKLKRAELQRNINDTRQRAATQQMIFAGLAVATSLIFALLAFGLVTIRRSRNDVRAANIDLAQTNAALGKALAAKTEFLATTSHEIRTPLNGILGMTQVMLADPTLGEPLRDRIGVVHGAGVTMRALVDDILDVAKMETGNLTIEHVPFDLQAMLREVSRLWEEQTRGRGLGFTLDLADCPRHIESDAGRLRQIVFNLLSNALKFTASGGITVRAKHGGDAVRPMLVLTVADTGIGIPPDKLDVIFESFRQADAGTTRKFGGTGLGLAICQNIARAMDGDVTVESVPGRGSVFTLSLPLVLAAAPEAPILHEPPQSALLILDRNPIARAMLKAVLEPRAGEVVFASTADEALAKITAGGIDRVLVDDATIGAASDPDAALGALARTPPMLALLWPAPETADRARFAALGVDRVVAKPIAGAALAAALFDDLGCDLPLAHLVTNAA